MIWKVESCLNLRQRAACGTRPAQILARWRPGLIGDQVLGGLAVAVFALRGLLATEGSHCLH